MKLRWASLIVTAVFAQAASAQLPDCASLMKFGLYDKESTASSNQLYDRFRNWLRNNHFETYQEATKHAEDAGLGIDIFGVGLNGRDAQSDYKNWQSAFLNTEWSDIEKEHGAADQLTHTLETVNTHVVDAVQKCLDLYQDGLFAVITPQQNHEDFVVLMRWRSSVDATPPRVRSFDMKPASIKKTCTGLDLVKAGDTLSRDGVVMTCSADSAVTVIITANFKGAAPLTLVRDGLRPTPTPASTPMPAPKPAPAPVPGPSPVVKPAAMTATVNMVGDAHGYRFEPANVSVRQGGLVTWRSLTAGPHSVVFDRPADAKAEAALETAISNQQNPLSLPSLSNGQSFALDLSGLPPGQYDFWCASHKALAMRGTLTVQR